MIDADRRIAQRRASVPKISYPAALPITEKKDEIAALIRDNQVVIVAGETGSGKSTQLPKICLELGRGITGMIGHTQPRRLAARTIAERVADELGTVPGATVGWKVRFTDRVGQSTLVKVMTDGILLAELGQDRQLRRYDTLIIDEAHERSLNVDFILGYLKRLLRRRPDLKLIITSATIDPERFSRHFDDAPMIEVSGRTYPVEVRYRPVADADQVQAIADATDELCAEGPGDILVFLSGEREIRDTADALRRRGDAEVLPLYARLSAADQHRVFAPHTGRRIVLATNVAETSLTVPGITYVIDPGTARISRYSRRTKVQRLPIEAISQASANQRKGRCGRTSNGICIRLYSEDDFASRQEFTDPEILRTNLASVILQMSAAGLGDIATFPFIDPPDRRNITDGIHLLQELGALDDRRRLTPLGRRLAVLPLDPRHARMILEAGRNDCVREVVVIAAALSIQDPRERPLDQQQAADEKHARFADEHSDFLTHLNLWNYLTDQQEKLSSNQFRRMCRAEFVNYLRVREWQDIEAQLRQLTGTIGVTVNRQPADSRAIHVSLLAGLLSHIGLREPDTREYQGARNTRFAIFPGSALSKRPPRWVMAAELVETSRLWARVAARIEPEWAERLAPHLIRRTYSEPRWDPDRGAVFASERVTLYGVPIIAARTVNYGRIDPVLSRELFIRRALVDGDWETRHEFLAENRRLLAEVEELEHRGRRRDIVVDDEALFAFYDERIDPDVVSARHFDSWWKKTRRTDPDLLRFDKAMLMRPGSAVASEQEFPDVWQYGDMRLPLTYLFEPGEPDDGVTVHVPLAVLNRVDGTVFTWQVPGLRHDLVVALIRSLPKRLRRNFVPAADYATAVLDRMTPYERPLQDGLSEALARMTGVSVPRTAWRLEAVPDHLRLTFSVIDETGRVLDADKDLDALRERLRPRMREALSAVADEIERTGLRAWTFGALPRSVERPGAGGRMRAYPALIDARDGVDIRLLESEAAQRAAMWTGTRRLLLLNVSPPQPLIRRQFTNQQRLALSHSPYGDPAALLDDCVACAADKVIADNGGPAWDERGFDALREKARAQLAELALQAGTLAARILAAAHDVQARLETLPSSAAQADISAQLSRLIYRGFLSAAGWDRLPDVLRYTQAIQRRLVKLRDDPRRDEQRMLAVQAVEASYQQLRAQLPASRALREIRWMLEELRVSYFAQELRTAYPISEQRIYRAMDRVRAAASSPVSGRSS